MPSRYAIFAWLICAFLLVPGKAVENSLSQKAYSNAVFSREGGEWVGSDMVLWHNDVHEYGYVMFYESYWLEPTHRTLCMDDLHVEGGIGHFSLHLDDFSGRYTIKFRTRSVELNRDEAESSGPVVLKAQVNPTTVISRIKSFDHTDLCAQESDSKGPLHSSTRAH